MVELDLNILRVRRVQLKLLKTILSHSLSSFDWIYQNWKKKITEQWHETISFDLLIIRCFCCVFFPYLPISNCDDDDPNECIANKWVIWLCACVCYNTHNIRASASKITWHWGLFFVVDLVARVWEREQAIASRTESTKRHTAHTTHDQMDNNLRADFGVGYAELLLARERMREKTRRNAPLNTPFQSSSSLEETTPDNTHLVCV